MDGSQYDWRRDATDDRPAWWMQRVAPGRGVLLMLMIAVATFGSIILLDRAGVRFPGLPDVIAAGG